MLNKVFCRVVLVIWVVSILSMVSLSYGQDDEATSSERGRSRSAQRQRRTEEAGSIDALEALVEKAGAGEKVEEGKVKEAIEQLGRSAWSLEPEQWLEKLNLLQQDKGEVSFPTRQKPLDRDNALERLIVSLEVRQMAKTAAQETKAHPSAKSFPGVIEEGAERVGRTVKIDTSAPGWHNNGIYGNPESPYWHSTGLYAAPGEVITVILPDSAVGKGLHVRIGAHSDGLWRNRSWQRAPDICRRFALDKKEVKAANAFGGLVYIEVPLDVKIGSIEARISNAVEAPYYVLGETNDEKWLSEIRNHKAPWGELATKKVILTLPAEVLRTVEKPRELMEFWDDIMDCYADLLGRDRQRSRAERFVSDLQISAGYMHSGYPLMTMLDITNAMVDKDLITSNGHHGIWGLFHEIGHNHQNRDWTFRGTTEVTVNVFSMYVMEQICRLTDDDKPHPSITQDERARKIEKYFGDGAKFEDWQRDPFLALIMYIQLKDEFGWDAFKKTFVQYRSLPDSDRPDSDDEKRDQWLIRFSRVVGKNLGPFFEAWGVPTGEQARASIAELPEWMPAGFEGKAAIGK